MARFPDGGPWNILSRKALDGSDRIDLKIMREDMKTQIAFVYPRKERRLMLANARLIAAAPDLLRVARIVVQYYEEEEGIPIEGPMLDTLYSAAKMALDKAIMPKKEDR
jgi:hypothetical protein